MATKDEDTGQWKYDSTPVIGNACLVCPTGSLCNGGTTGPQGGDYETTENTDCGPDYAGSLYQKMVKYATQVCVRPSDYDAITTGKKSIPTTVLQDVNVVMDSVRVNMSKSLSAECERLGGTWVDTQWIDDNNDDVHDKTTHKLLKYFYDETGANTKWGYCADTTSVSTATQDL